MHSLIAQAENDKEDRVLLQLDIQKAFDSVSWQYLQEVLNNFNFSIFFIDWVATLYAQKELHILNNGHLSDTIYPSNGLAQGDGLSPLLFVLVIETLALSLRANQKIVRYQFAATHKKLSMLADDMLLSLKAKQSSIKAVFKPSKNLKRFSI